MPNSINIKIKEINFCNKKPFTIVFSSNSIINVELWLEDYKFLNIVSSFGENLFDRLMIHCTNASQISYLANILGSKQYSLITNIKYDGEKMCVILILK
jgi:hypothetical protein